MLLNNHIVCTLALSLSGWAAIGRLRNFSVWTHTPWPKGGGNLLDRRRTPQDDHFQLAAEPQSRESDTNAATALSTVTPADSSGRSGAGAGTGAYSLG